MGTQKSDGHTKVQWSHTSPMVTQKSDGHIKVRWSAPKSDHVILPVHMPKCDGNIKHNYIVLYMAS